MEEIKDKLSVIWTLLIYIVIMMPSRCTDETNTDKIVNAIENHTCSCQGEKE